MYFEVSGVSKQRLDRLRENPSMWNAFHAGFGTEIYWPAHNVSISTRRGCVIKSTNSR